MIDDTSSGGLVARFTHVILCLGRGAYSPFAWRSLTMRVRGDGALLLTLINRLVFSAKSGSAVFPILSTGRETCSRSVLIACFSVVCLLKWAIGAMRNYRRMHRLAAGPSLVSTSSNCSVHFCLVEYCLTSFARQGLAAYVASLIDRTLDWNDIKWLRTICGSMKVSG